MHQVPGDADGVRRIVGEIIAAETGNDFITFTSREFESITLQRKYKGVSFQLVGQIKNTKTPFSVDFAVGDVIVPHPQRRNIPVQLDDFAIPTVLAYSLESTIAEKFEALLQRLELTSRMKDIYDIYYLSQSFEYEGRQLQSAIFETLRNRGTVYQQNSFDRVVSLKDDKEIQLRWKLFLRRIKFPDLKLELVMNCIDSFLRPVWNSIMEENDLLLTWDRIACRWK